MVSGVMPPQRRSLASSGGYTWACQSTIMVYISQFILLSVSFASCAKVLPSRIGGFDQPDLLGPQPALDGFLPSNRYENIACFFVVDKLSDVVPGREAWNLLQFMLPHA